MTRPIKFRAWDETENEMLYDVWACPKGGWIAGLRTGRNIMQFTGLKDKNGKEIFEGDVVREEMNQMVYEIKSQPSYFTAEERGYRFPLYSLKYPLEIIGNIYQHPQLLR